jgi:hypothetical protein
MKTGSLGLVHSDKVLQRIRYFARVPVIAFMPRLTVMAVAAAITAAFAALSIRAASSQEIRNCTPMTECLAISGHEQMAGMMDHQCPCMMQHQDQPATGTHEHQAAAVEPTLSGQDAFSAIQEIVHILEADPKTDWSKVNFEALRQHLIDMNEVTLKAGATTKPIDGGIEVSVTGTGRTAEAIRRMVPAHARQIEQTHLNGWSAKTDPLPDGVLLTVTAADPKEVQHIRGLGFIGIMVSGHHHQPHHLAIVRGQMMH